MKKILVIIFISILILILIAAFVFKPKKTTTKDVMPTPTPPFTQNQGDALYQQDYKNMITQKPFLKKLPIVMASYTIVYDFEKNSIRVRIKNIPEGKTLDDLKNEVKGKLNEIHVPSQIPIEWIIP